MLTVPYLTVAELKAAPTFINLGDLVPGASVTKNEAELRNQILKASAWCDNEAQQQLGAHTGQVNTRISPDREGRFTFHPPESPVRQITAFAYGPDPTNLLTLTSPSSWIEGGVMVTVTPTAGAGSSWTGALQFGSPPPGRALFVQYGYVSGFVNTVLAADAAAGATSIVVADPTGIGPGDTLRLWDPGVEEAVVVAAGYSRGQATVPLAAALTDNHSKGVGSLSGMPPDLKQAVVEATCSKIAGRKLAGGQQIQGATLQPTATANGTAGGQRSRRIVQTDLLLAAAAHTLRSYRPVR